MPLPKAAMGYLMDRWGTAHPAQGRGLSLRNVPFYPSAFWVSLTEKVASSLGTGGALDLEESLQGGGFPSESAV